MLKENICLSLLPKNAHGIRQRPTLEIPEDLFIVVSSADTDEMPHSASLLAKVPLQGFPEYRGLKDAQIFKII